MKKAALTPGQDYMTYRGDDPAAAFDAQRVRLLTDHGVDVSSSSNAPGLDMEIDERTVHIPGAKAAKAGGTHLVFERVDPKTGQPEGKYTLLTPAQIKHPWDEGVTTVVAARDEVTASRKFRQQAREERDALAESLTSRVSNLLSGNRPALKASPYDDRGLVIDGQTLSDLIDLAQRAKFGQV